MVTRSMDCNFCSTLSPLCCCTCGLPYVDITAARPKLGYCICISICIKMISNRLVYICICSKQIATTRSLKKKPSHLDIFSWCIGHQKQVRQHEFHNTLALKALSPWEMFVEKNWTTHRSRVRHSKGRSWWEGSSKDIKNLTYVVGSNVDEDDEVDQGFEILGKWKSLSLSLYSRMPNQIRATKSPMKTLWNLVNSCTAAAGQPLRTLNHLPRNQTQLIRSALKGHQSILGGLQIANCKPPQSFGTVGSEREANCFGRRVPRALNEWDCPHSSARRPKSWSTRTWVLYNVLTGSLASKLVAY